MLKPAIVSRNTLLPGITVKGAKEIFTMTSRKKTVIVLNCILKGLWRWIDSRGIRKKLKRESTAYL